jgi:HEAT repeat protein
MRLRSGNPEVRRRVVWALGQSGDPRAVELLATALRDGHYAVNASAAKALIGIGDARAIDALTAALRDGNEGVRRVVVGAFEDQPAPWGVELLAAALRDDDGPVRGAAVKALAKSGDDRAVGHLAAALRDKVLSVRWVAFEAVARSRDPRLVGPLAAALGDRHEDDRLRRQAAEILGRSGDLRALPPLIAALRKEDWFLKATAAEALHALGWEPPTPGERAALAVARGKFEEAAAEGPAAVAPLAAALEPIPEHFHKGSILKALATIDDPTVVPILLAALESPDRLLRHGAVRELRTAPAVAAAIRRADGPDALLRLVPLLIADDREVREGVAEALVGAHGEKAIRLLIEAVKAPGGGLRPEAAEGLRPRGTYSSSHRFPSLATALGALAGALRARGWKPKGPEEKLAAAIHRGRLDAVLKEGTEAVDLLGLFLEDPGCGAIWARAIPEALGRSGAPRAIPVLIAALQSEDGLAAESAAEALGQIRDDRAVEALVALLGQKPRDRFDYDRLRRLEDLKEVAAEVLGRTGDTRAVGPLIAVISQATGKQPDFRLHLILAAAVKGLGQLRDARAVPALAALLRPPADGDYDLATEAAEGLALIGDRRAVEPLVRALGRLPGPVAVALGQLGDARAVPPLLALLAVPDRSPWEARKAAVEALAKLGAVEAVRPLAEASRDGYLARAAVTAMAGLAETAAGRIPDDGLRALARLEDRTQFGWRQVDYGCSTHSEIDPALREPVDASRVRQLARQELARRGRGDPLPAPEAPAGTLAITCPRCGKQGRAPATFAGRTVKCPNCQATVTVPHPRR